MRETSAAATEVRMYTCLTLLSSVAAVQRHASFQSNALCLILMFAAPIPWYKKTVMIDEVLTSLHGHIVTTILDASLFVSLMASPLGR